MSNSLFALIPGDACWHYQQKHSSILCLWACAVPKSWQAAGLPVRASLRNEARRTPSPFARWHKDVPLGPKVSASSRRCQLAPPSSQLTSFPPLFPKQRVSDTCNIPVAGVSERNQGQDLSLLTLSVACPLFLWSFYYRSAISSISSAHHSVQL